MHIHYLEGILYFESNLDEMIYSLAGMELWESGFMITLALVQSGMEHFYGQVPQNFSRYKVSEHTFLGKGVFQALLTSESHRIQVLPVMFPLPFAHGLPIGQIFSPEIGSLTFWKTSVDMAGNTVATSDIHNSLQWINNMQLLNEWLDAVAANLGQFCVPCMAHTSIAESLAVLKEVVGETAMLLASRVIGTSPLVD